MIKQRILAAAGLAAILGGCYFSGSGRVGLSPESTPTPTQSPTAVATQTITPTLQTVTAEPVRVQFKRGTWGETITSSTSTKYLLWAAQGQVFTTTLSSPQTTLASLYAPDGKPLYEGMASGNTAAAKLPADGDYTLEIKASGQFTVEVEIR